MLALNRSAIVVRPKPPFLAWLHATDPTSVTVTLVALGRDGEREPTCRGLCQIISSAEERHPDALSLDFNAQGAHAAARQKSRKMALWRQAKC
jgi:hypothetical protein